MADSGSVRLGYQPYGADWVSQTTNDFATGIPVAVVALIGFAAFFASLLGTLRAAGIIAARPRRTAQAQETFQPQPAAAAVAQGDLDRTLATLASALAADLATRHQQTTDQLNTRPIEQNITGREL